MHETPKQVEQRWNAYRSGFATMVRERGARQPDTDTIRDYFDEAIDLNLAVGHYIVERYRLNKNAPNVAA